MNKEIWKDIVGYEGLYQVSNFGRIKSLYNYRGKGFIWRYKSEVMPNVNEKCILF